MQNRNVNTTPAPIFDEETGYLYLKRGMQSQIVARFDEDGCIYVWWKRSGGEEVALTMDLLTECRDKMV